MSPVCRQVLFDLIEEVPFTEIVERCSMDWTGRKVQLVTETKLNAIHETAGAVVGQVHAFCEGMRAAGNGWGRMADLMARFQVQQCSPCLSSPLPPWPLPLPCFVHTYVC